jgi:hypothetical protein
VWSGGLLCLLNCEIEMIREGIRQLFAYSKTFHNVRSNC